MSGDHTEVELKFQLPRGSRTLLERHPALARATAQSSHLVSTYFDTPDRALDRLGLTLRVRRDGSTRTQTVKSRSDGQGVAESRCEWEWPIDRDLPELQWLAQTAPLAEAARAVEHRLQPVFLTDVQRTARLVRLGEDTTVEVAFDEGRIEAGEAVETICEMELELKSGRQGPLYRLAATLQSLAPLWLMQDSKAARGWHLAVGADSVGTERAQSARAPKLKRKMSAAEAFRQLLDSALGHLARNIGLVLRRHPEALHQARVAIREVRALLQLFEPCLDRAAVRRFSADLRQIAQVLGAARDLDVFCLQTLPAAMSALAPTCLDDLKAAAEAERQHAYEDVALALRGAQFTRLVLELAEWAHGEAFDPAPDREDGLHRRLAELAPTLLRRSVARVERRGHHVGHLSAQKRHSLRKSLKKLNFDVKCLARLCEGKRVKRYRRRVATLVGLLGAANDVVVSRGLTAKLLDPARPELSDQALALNTWNALRGRKASNGVKRAMDKFRKVSASWS